MDEALRDELRRLAHWLARRREVDEAVAGLTAYGPAAADQVHSHLDALRALLAAEHEAWGAVEDASPQVPQVPLPAHLRPEHLTPVHLAPEHPVPGPPSLDEPAPDSPTPVQLTPQHLTAEHLTEPLSPEHLTAEHLTAEHPTTEHLAPAARPDATVHWLRERSS